MQLVCLLTLFSLNANPDAFKIGSAKSAVAAAKKFLTGTQKAKSIVHGTPLANTSPGSVGTSEGGIMKKSVDFLANSALIVGGVSSIYDHFAEPETPVSTFFIILDSLFHFYFKAPTPAPAPKHTPVQ